ncbi:hypothetical protein SISNIDRAFT_493923 [Sistotremastrum niveocremeum HHB9708]|uniref:Uncharacterized protein n=2 Tax=Sistotremastraceae TaxID=3402574 RepID=A0A164XXF0_9AGAM|nr:hypothetical protein SISNIDRAFT_493923 [Sistotremastrum niveocremeum HHB9708]KZT35329.1 hypothetical protein SISSUDRAFT_1121673 [Sistotremastrum suecicum HHB10207 ss-3]
MSEYGPPTENEIRQWKTQLSRTANWVSNHSSPTASSPSSSRPSTSRTNSNSSHSHHRSPTSPGQLPPLPPGFKYAAPGTPVSFATQSATYYVVPPGQDPAAFVNSPQGSSPHRSHHRSSSHHHSSSSRTSTPQPHNPRITTSGNVKVTYVTGPSPGPMRPPVYHAYSTPSPAYIQPKKEKPLLQRLFGLGPSTPPPRKSHRRERRHSTGAGGNSRDNGLTIAW